MKLHEEYEVNEMVWGWIWRYMKSMKWMRWYEIG